MAGAETFRVGLRIDRYELVRQVAEGGFGVIYVARDVNLGRDLAIKFLLPQHNSNQEIVNRFVNEARTLARVVHPGIVTVYESGEVSGTNTAADGTAFILMELLEGETLAQRLKRTGPLAPQTAMEICRQVANALHAAHKLGMVHRDLKPDNIMLVKDPAIAIGERAKVLDFGIAKNSGSNSNATQIGMVFGTPAYMSPEQCRSSADVTPASDVYSLGCILFELLIGRPPFPGTGMGELFAHHLMSAPPSARAINPSLPKHLDDVIMAMLQKEPTARPANMEVIERILEESRLGDKPARTRTLGGATLLAGSLPFNKPGELPQPRLITPVMGVPSTTERGVGRPTPVAQPTAQISPVEATLLGAARPKIPTAEQAMEIMRARSPSQANVPTQAVPIGNNAHMPTGVTNVGNAHLPTMAVNTRSHPATGPHMPTMAIAPAMAAVPGSGPRERPGTGPQYPQMAGPIPPMGAPRMPNPTTVSNAVGQQTARPASGGGSKVWLIGAVLGAIAIAVTIVLVAGGGSKESAKEPDPIGSADHGSAIAPTPGSAAVPTPGSAAVPTPGSAAATGSNPGSATPAKGSDAGSATPMVGSNAGSATGSNAGSASGSNAGSSVAAGSNAGSATQAVGSNAGSAKKPDKPNTGSNAGSATPLAGSNAGSAKKPDKPKDPKAGSGSAKKCVGRDCILDDGQSF